MQMQKLKYYFYCFLLFLFSIVYYYFDYFNRYTLWGVIHDFLNNSSPCCLWIVGDVSPICWLVHKPMIWDFAARENNGLRRGAYALGVMVRNGENLGLRCGTQAHAEIGGQRCGAAAYKTMVWDAEHKLMDREHMLIKSWPDLRSASSNPEKFKD